MTKPQSAKVAEYARRAAKLPATERESYLDDVCGSDRDLREAVLEAVRQAELREELLRTGGGLDIAARFDRGASEEEPGTQIGPYTLVRRIGTGGFGVVHEARQEEPVKRQVALKVLKAGMDTESVLARFESERQALAVLEHPNIARILDAGATPQGRPYFVMELVKGESITDYCDRQRLSIDERIKLLIPVCRAVQHAHQKGIIHRDLKPSNVLVSEADGEATPVVIDFGIAKINTGELADLTLYTREGELVGTPAFMSPEQISGQDVDTRADVYALGVLLYRLLTGRLPFELDALRKVGLAEIQRILCEDTPPKPSASFAPTLTASAGGNRCAARTVRRGAAAGELHRFGPGHAGRKYPDAVARDDRQRLRSLL
ncbi:MAG: serine/threonine-protein kinase, partial [Pseudomonadota bacterium]